MSRLASQTKLGFYPTPPITAQLIPQMLIPPAQENSYLLDPCSGEGEALAAIATQLKGLSQGNVLSYGVELEAKRVRQSQAKLDRVCGCSIFDLICTKQSFSLLYLNPPYDFDFRVGSRATRLEKTFYKDVVDYLAPDGVLVFLLPLSALDPFLAKALCYRFEKAQVFRLPKEEFSRFGQIVIFGVRKKKSTYEEEAAELLLKSASNSRHLDPEIAAAVKYRLPAAPGPSIFRDKHPSVEESANELQNSALNKHIDEILAPPETLASTTPLMPLRLAHIACLLTAGLMNGCIKNGTETIVVKGFTEQATETRREQVDEHTTKETEIKKAKTVVRYFNHKGELFEVR